MKVKGQRANTIVNEWHEMGNCGVSKRRINCTKWNEVEWQMIGSCSCVCERHSIHTLFRMGLHYITDCFIKAFLSRALVPHRIHHNIPFLSMQLSLFFIHFVHMHIGPSQVQILLQHIDRVVVLLLLLLQMTIQQGVRAHVYSLTHSVCFHFLFFRI